MQLDNRSIIGGVKGTNDAANIEYVPSTGSCKPLFGISYRDPMMQADNISVVLAYGDATSSASGKHERRTYHQDSVRVPSVFPIFKVEPKCLDHNTVLFCPWILCKVALLLP
jgi:hypothetical protein